MCGYATHGWVCDAGTLILPESRHSLNTPCPACRTEVYLGKAWKAADMSGGCACCPGQGADIWAAAIAAARAANPAAATTALRTVKARHRFKADAPSW